MGKISLQASREDSEPLDADGNTGPDDLSGHEDDEDDVDMDEDNDNSTITHTDHADVGTADGRFERTPPPTEPTGIRSFSDTTPQSPADAMDASLEADVDKTMSKGELSPALVDASPTPHNGRTAEEDSPLTSADTRDTPSPLLLPANDAFVSQMTGDHHPYDDSGDEDDGNLTDATASTIPLSHHSDDEDNLDSVSILQYQSTASQEKNEEAKISPAHLTPPSNGPVNTLYRRRRVLSPSSPIEGTERSIATPSGVKILSDFHGSPERAPSSSLSPVLPSNSLAEMFNEEESRATPRTGRTTPAKDNAISSISPKADLSGEEPPASESPLNQRGSPANGNAATSVTALNADVRNPVIKDFTLTGQPVTHSETGDDQATEPSATVTADPASQPVTESFTEPAPAPKKRRLDLKKFMTGKRTNVLEATISPPRAPEDSIVNDVSTATTSQTNVIGNESPVSSSLLAPAAVPPPLSPPPPPPILSPTGTDVPENSKSNETPWWTAPSTSRPSFSSVSETRPKLGAVSADLTRPAALDSTSPEVSMNAERMSKDEKPVVEPLPVTLVPSPNSTVRPWSLIEVEDKDQEQNGFDVKAFSTFSLGIENGATAHVPSALTPRSEPPKALTSPFDWHSKLPTANSASHWSKIPPALEQKDLPPHVDPDSRRSDKFGSMSSASRSPPKSSLLLMSPQRMPPAGPRASLAPVRPLELKDTRDLSRDREIDRDRDIRERDREREVPRGPRMEYRGRGGVPRGTAFTPRGTWHAEPYRGRARGTGEFRGRGFFPRGRGAFFNNRGRGT